MRILAQSNLIFLKTFDLKRVKVLYAPLYFSEIQRAFYLKRFQELKKISPTVKWTESLSEDEFDLALVQNAAFERKAFGDKIHQGQNRLFSSLPFSLPESFTPFRLLAEKHLPAMYDEAISPWDEDVLNELHYYFKEKRLASTYFETRNEMTGREGSTKFSAFLSSGVLDVRFLYNEVRSFEREFGSNKSTGWIIFELLWREFFYWHYQKHQTRYFSANGLKGKLQFPPITVPTVPELKSLTKEPFFHAALNELTTTGFLSNRSRQIFASIWINDLELPWLAGARFFEEELIDYDVFSNYGNWMYLAGVGVDPRGKRYFNVQKQLAEYDPAGTYLKQWL